MSLTIGDLIGEQDIISQIGFITVDYYKNEYKGTDPIDDDLLTKLIGRATDEINALAQWELDNTLDGLLTSTKNLIYKATASQVEYYVLNGETYNYDKSNNVKIGNYGYGQGGNSNNGSVLCDKSYMYLEQTGLLYRGIDSGVCYE